MTPHRPSKQPPIVDEFRAFCLELWHDAYTDDTARVLAGFFICQFNSDAAIADGSSTIDDKTR